MTLNPDSPDFTAAALGEGPPDRRDAFQRALAESPALRREAERTRRAARLLGAALRRETAVEGVPPIKPLPRPVPRPARRPVVSAPPLRRKPARHPLSKLFPVAAAAAALALLVAGGARWIDHSNQTGSPFASRSSEKTVAKTPAVRVLPPPPVARENAPAALSSAARPGVVSLSVPPPAGDVPELPPGGGVPGPAQSSFTMSATPPDVTLPPPPAAKPVEDPGPAALRFASPAPAGR